MNKFNSNNLAKEPLMLRSQLGDGHLVVSANLYSPMFECNRDSYLLSSRLVVVACEFSRDCCMFAVAVFTMSDPVGVGIMSHDGRSHDGRLCCKHNDATVSDVPFVMTNDEA